MSDLLLLDNQKVSDKDHPLKAKESSLDDKKNIVSIRLSNADRDAVRIAAARLFVRESELYRFAVRHLLNRLHHLLDESFTGCELLPLFLEFSDEINAELGLKKHQLFEILNRRTAGPEKFVAMSDVELLLLPQHVVRQRLLHISDASPHRHTDTRIWLEQYFRTKYLLPESYPEQSESNNLLV
jgi:hypothetical protein